VVADFNVTFFQTQGNTPRRPVLKFGARAGNILSSPVQHLRWRQYSE
jgi:hypothetical protein